MKKFKLTYFYKAGSGFTLSLFGDTLYDLALISETQAWTDLLKQKHGLAEGFVNGHIVEEYDPEAKEWFEWVDTETDNDDIFEYLKRTSPSEYAKLMSYRKQYMTALAKELPNNK